MYPFNEKSSTGELFLRYGQVLAAFGSIPTMLPTLVNEDIYAYFLANDRWANVSKTDMALYCSGYVW